MQLQEEETPRAGRVCATENAERITLRALGVRNHMTIARSILLSRLDIIFVSLVNEQCYEALFFFKFEAGSPDGNVSTSV